VLTTLLIAESALAEVINVYWSDRNAGTLSVTEVATDQTQLLADGFTRLQDVDLDTNTGTLFLAEWGQPGPPGGQGAIYLINTNGTGQTQLLSTGDAVHQLALDESAQHIYYTRAVSYDGREISRIDMNGANYTNLFGGDGWFYSGLALDLANNAVYWGDIGVIGGTVNGAVNTMTLTGATPTLLAPHVDGRGRGMAIDLASQTIFLTAHNPLDPTTGGGLFSYDIASGVLTELIDDPTTGYWDIEIDSVAQRIWWADSGRGEIRSANFDGTDVQVELSGLGSVYGIALETDLAIGTARFPVTKTFSDGQTGDIDVTLTCNAGLPLQQNFTISGGGPGVTFTLTNIPDGGADCTVTESNGPAGYTPSLNAGAGCTFTDVVSGTHTCTIENVADPGEYTVSKEWLVADDEADILDLVVDISVTCSADILTVNGVVVAPSTDYTGSLQGNDDVVLGVDTTTGSATCSASETYALSGVEESASAGCTDGAVTAAGTTSCHFTNTLFFEGIPALDRYGLALLALLMITVGFVAVRRTA
jgi:hypothetical protein